MSWIPAGVIGYPVRSGDTGLAPQTTQPARLDASTCRVVCTCEPWVKKLVHMLAHSQEREFLQQLESTPSDGTVMLVYADWLEERGRGAEAKDLRTKAADGRPWNSD